MKTINLERWEDGNLILKPLEAKIEFCKFRVIKKNYYGYYIR